QPCEFCLAVRARLFQRRPPGRAAAGAHARPQQRRACRRLAEESDAIALDPPAIVVAAPDLLGAGPRGLALRTLAPRDAGVGLQLVDRVERRRVAGRVER